MTETTHKPLVAPQEVVLERYVTRRWLGLFTYEVRLSLTSVGHSIYIVDETMPEKVIVNGIEFSPLT